MAEVTYVECDTDLKRRVGEKLGGVAERHVILENGFTWIALDGEEIVGLLAVRRRRLPEPLPETEDGFVNIIEVIPSHRRRGIARRMVELSIERCRELGLYQLRGWSSVDKTEAIPAWKALGFTLCPGIELHDGQEIEGYLFACRL